MCVFVYLHVLLCMPVLRVYMEVRGQLTEVSFPFHPCGSWGSSSKCLHSPRHLMVFLLLLLFRF